MPSHNNISYLGTLSMPKDRPDAKTMIKVDHVTMIFNIASEQLNSLKEYAIALSRRELRFKEFRALDDVSFEVKQGDVFGILGTNGSGKSTMLKIIAGVLEPSKGSCTVEGNIAPLIELGAGFDLELTARENIFLNGALLGYSKKFIQDHFEEIVEFAEVRDFLDMPMKNYSSGMVARIAFAIATVIVPDVLIVDEVLSVGDFMFQQKCERRIQSLIKEHGVTVLIVSHSNDQIQRLCNKAVWIEKGHLRAIGAAKEVCEIYRAIGGRSGSPESEKKILDLLSENTTPPITLRDSVYGDDRYSTAVQANDYVDAPHETVIVINSDSEKESRVATALAGALDASLLTVQHDRIPDVTMQEMKHGNPKRVILVGNESQISDSVHHAFAKQLTDAEVVRVGADITRLSLDAARFAISQGASWGGTALVFDASATTAMLLLAPYSFLCKTPVFFLDENDLLTDEEKEFLSAFDRLVISAPPSKLSDEDIESFSPSANVVRFFETSEPKLVATLNRWLVEERKFEGKAPFGSLLITSPDSVIDNHIAGPLAGRLDALILLEDPQNLDSIAHAIDAVKLQSVDIRHIVYLGNEMRFSQLNKELLAKAVINTR